MSRIESTTRHTLASAGILLTATLAVPSVTPAQSTIEAQMLLNRVAPTVSRYQDFGVPLFGAMPAESAERFDGAAAMGGTAGIRRLPWAEGTDTIAREARITGEQALLGHVLPIRSPHQGDE